MLKTLKLKIENYKMKKKKFILSATGLPLYLLGLRSANKPNLNNLRIFLNLLRRGLYITKKTIYRIRHQLNGKKCHLLTKFYFLTILEITANEFCTHNITRISNIANAETANNN